MIELPPVIITGSRGFIGNNLSAFLEKKGGMVFRCDIDVRSSSDELENFFRTLGLDRAILVHLAGMSFVPACEQDPGLAMEVNAIGALAVVSAFQKVIPKGVVLFASTAQVYSGPNEYEAQLDGDEVVPWSESRTVEPQNVYAKTKFEAECLLRKKSAETGLRVVVLRLFNHVHKTQDSRFFLPTVYQQLRQIGDGPAGSKNIRVGNLKLKRDFGSLRDLMRAFESVLNRAFEFPVAFEVFNVCSGRAQDLGQLVRILASRLGVDAEFELDPSRIRVGEPKVILGSPRKLMLATDWSPSIQSEENLIDAFLTDI